MPGWLEGRGGQPEGYCHRQMIDAIRYLVAGGITWRAMPSDFPAWDRVYVFWRRWGTRAGRANCTTDFATGSARPRDGTRSRRSRSSTRSR
ncbi:transposase [Streptomyces sp. NPDC007983]|uniref:transposase n=1 Tax=Streptomyces sp. NPDC007983 TaxID=3364800 RepID=UPI0036E66C36